MGKVYDEASQVTAEQGEVQVDGPDGVAVSLTPEAARETAGRLTEGAAQAASDRQETSKDKNTTSRMQRP